MTYRLIAFDYDGTAARDGNMPSERVRAAIAAARGRGALTVLATGRPYDSAKGYAEALGLDTPVICFQGAMVRELVGDRRVLFVEPAPADAMAEILSLADERALELVVYVGDTMFAVDRGRESGFYKHWFGVPTTFVRSYGELADDLAATGSAPLKGLFIGSAEKNDSFHEELVRRFGDRLGVVRSHEMFVEVHSKQASKGHSLRFLAGYYGVSQDETIAVGDAGNDISMIEWAGLGIAMANGSPAVRASADEIAPSVADDGLADVLERYFP